MISVQADTVVFQSTLPRGERHAITKTYLPDVDDFNPRSHEGSDSATRGGSSWFYDFNPRSHEGSDKSKCAYKIAYIYFNPRSHEGSDG